MFGMAQARAMGNRPEVHTDNIGQVGGMKPGEIRSKRVQPVNHADFPTLSTVAWQAMLRCYWVGRTCGIERVQARREARVMLELWMWAQVKKTELERLEKRRAAAAKKK